MTYCDEYEREEGASENGEKRLLEYIMMILKT
jgi:hypothetical protein